jgi:hypothetical protein
LMSIIISNLSLSIILEWYSDSLKEKSRDKSKEGEQYDHLFQTIVSRARVRRVLTSNGTDPQTLYDNIRMVKSHDSNSDHRLKFVEKGSTITKSDLKKCQKYAKINLVDFSEAQSKEIKNLTWEADFVKDLLQGKIGKLKKFAAGEVLCYQDTPALEGFILTTGLAEIRLSQKDSHKKDIVIKALQLLGGSCLSPVGQHSHTCVAASDDVECIVITKDAVRQDIDQHIVGQLLRLYYKTNDDIERASLESAKRRPFRFSSVSASI